MTVTRYRGLIYLACRFRRWVVRMFAQKTPTPAAPISRGRTRRDARRRRACGTTSSCSVRKRSPNPSYTHTWATLVTTTEAAGGPPVGPRRRSAGCPSISRSRLCGKPCRGGTTGCRRRFAPCSTKQDLALWGPYEVWHGFATVPGRRGSSIPGRSATSASTPGVRPGGPGRVRLHPRHHRYGTQVTLFLTVTRCSCTRIAAPASARVVRRIMALPHIHQPATTHDWLLPRLGLDAYPIEHREYHGRVESYDPTSGRAGLEYVAPPLRPAAAPQPKVPVPEPKTGEPTKGP